jgi:hypothetical protein
MNTLPNDTHTQTALELLSAGELVALADHLLSLDAPRYQRAAFVAFARSAKMTALYALGVDPPRETPEEEKQACVLALTCLLLLVKTAKTTGNAGGASILGERSPSALVLRSTMTNPPKTQRSATIKLNKLGEERAKLCAKMGRRRLYSSYQGPLPEEAKAEALWQEMVALHAYGKEQGWSLYHSQLFAGGVR